jgi:alpha-L-fucosidase 2
MNTIKTKLTIVIALAAGGSAFARFPAVPEPDNPTTDFRFTGQAPAPEEPLTLWYRRPGIKWERDALPVGNGRMGAMVFGGIDHERIQFNEETVWDGVPTD